MGQSRKDKGFTLVELIVVMAIFGIAITLAAQGFVSVLKHSKAQSKIAETEMEKVLALEMLRWDIEHAGYGLPWYYEDLNGDGDYSNDWNYQEAVSQNVCDPGHDISTYNDAPYSAPRGILSGNNVCSNGSDYLVIKSTVVRINDEAQKWTYVWNDPATNTNNVNTWGNPQEDLNDNSIIIAIRPNQTKTIEKMLVTYLDVGSGDRFFYTSFSNAENYVLNPNETLLLFGLGDDNAARMPFNRGDYYINFDNPPDRCASGTGVLIKAVLSHQDGALTGFYPLLDCVADFQVGFGVDTTSSPDGQIDCYTNNLQNVLSVFGYDAEDVRERVKEIRVYVLAHEGQKDPDFTFASDTVLVGDGTGLTVCGTEGTLGRNFDLTSIPDWQRYRWAVYTIVAKPENLSL